MGAINYYTSDYITLGFNLNSYSYEDAKKEMQNILNDYDFSYFHLILKSGYYKGFILTIDSNYPLAFNNSEDKAMAQKEITQIKTCLKRLIDNNMCIVHSGWCTDYLTDTKERYSEIEKAVKAMRKEVKNTPTWYDYEHNIYRSRA